MIESCDLRERVTVELKRSGQRMSLRRDKLQLVPEDDFQDLPPLRCIRQKFQVGQKLFVHMKQQLVCAI